MSFSDWLVGIFSPQRALRRQYARRLLTRFNALEAGKIDRTSRDRPKAQPGDKNLAETKNARYKAQQQLLDNPYSNKAVRSIANRVLGGGLTGKSEAVRDGEPWTEFRKAAEDLFRRWSKHCDHAGPPGRGGYTLDDLFVTGWRELPTAGEFLVRRHVLSTAEWKRRQKEYGLEIPLTISLNESDRLVDDAKPSNGNKIFRGVEFDENGRRVAYHIYKHNPHHPAFSGSREVVRLDASDVLHIMRPDQIGQFRGITWLAPTLNTLAAIRDYEVFELTAAKMAACLALLIESDYPGLDPLNAGSLDSTDDDGNRIEDLQPGMVGYLAPGEKAVAFKSDRPNSDAPEFLSYMLRGIAAGTPAVKSSTITGDYRRSSFSAERAATNDLDPEAEQLQRFFFSACCEPIWGWVIDSGLQFSDRFAGIATAGDDKGHCNLCASSWRGPTSRSVNPVQDSSASMMMIQQGLSSIQIECAKRGIDYKQVLDDASVLLEQAREKGLPEAFINNLFGVDVQPLILDEDDEEEPGDD